MGAGRWGDHLARRRSRHVGGVLLVPARASRATTWVLVDAVHARPRHGPRPVAVPAVLTAHSSAAASAVRQSPDSSTDPDVPPPIGFEGCPVSLEIGDSGTHESGDVLATCGVPRPPPGRSASYGEHIPAHLARLTGRPRTSGAWSVVRSRRDGRRFPGWAWNGSKWSWTPQTR